MDEDLRRGPNDESGAVLVILVLSLMAMFGMMVLVVDVGSLLFARRAMVNAADAAALAAAQSCGQKEGLAEANAQATKYTVANESGAAVVSGFPQYFPSCDAPAGIVKVRVTSDQPLFFAPVLGADSETPVSTEATAQWGGAGAGTKVAPLMLSANRLSDCQIPPEDPESLPEGVECAFWWNNSPTSDPEDLANAEWGTLDLWNWDVEPPVHCNNSTPPEFQEWMLVGFPLPLPISPPTTYVCRGQGNFGAALNNIIEDAILEGDPLYFPVNDPQTQIDSAGNLCPPPDPADPDAMTCAVDKYNIIGFAKLEIVGLYRGNSPEAAAYCSEVPEADRDANARCMVAKWVEYTSEGFSTEDPGENYGLVPVRLVE